MKLNVSTTVFQEMVAKAIKGASNNKMIPITSLMAIEVKDSILTLTTTDATNTLKVRYTLNEADDFYVVVPAEIISKLVAKTTTDNMNFTVDENNVLLVKGNGDYALELPLDETGSLIKFPEYVFNEDLPKSVINLSTIKAVLTTNKAALAETMEIPCLTGYYCGENEVISTDTFKVCGNHVSVFEKPVLIPAEVMNLLSLMTEDKISVQQEDGKILFTTKDIIVYGTELEGIEDYPIDAIKAYLDTSFESSCKISKDVLLNVLDRLSLFVELYDKNGLYMTFTKDSIIINSKRSNGTEKIPYISSDKFVPFACCVDIQLLQSQVSAINASEIQLWFGHEKAIKLTSGNITQVIALLEDDRITTEE